MKPNRPIKLLLCLALVTQTIAQNTKNAIHLKYFDTSVRPQDDFYQFVNGTWMKTTEIPPDKSRWGSFDALREYTDSVSLGILKTLLEKKFPDKSDEQKIQAIYETFMATEQRNKLGIKPLIPYLKKIDAIKNLNDLEKYLTEQTPSGNNPLYGFYISAHAKNSNQNAVYLSSASLGLGRDYYQKSDAKTEETLKDYVEYIESIFNYCGVKNAKQSAQQVLEFEKAIAKNLLTVEQIRDAKLRFNPRSLSQLSRMTRNIRLPRFLNRFGIKSDSVIISEIKYYEAFDTLISLKNLPLIKSYLKFHLINSAADLLDEKLEELNFEFFGRKLRGQKEQRAKEKRALSLINNVLGEAFGKLYVKEVFPEEAKRNCEEMVSYLVKSFEKHIRELNWMSPETKSKALDKLRKFTVKIGYPNKWKDYSKLVVNGLRNQGNLFSNMMNVRNWRFRDNLSKYGKPVDKTEWGMSPQTVNAYYSSRNNEIVFPAAILQPPFFDFKADPAVNFGGIGAVIGHEISHGFDDSGSQYDGDGNLNNWWTEEDKRKFELAGKALEEQYNQYEPIPGVKVNGKFTLGENIADLGGVAVAYDALKMYLKDKGSYPPIDNFTPEQRFFLSWATIWRTKATDKFLVNQVKTDPHSPGYYRANGPLMNVDAFHEVFETKPGDGMWKDKDKRIVIW